MCLLYWMIKVWKVFSGPNSSNNLQPTISNVIADFGRSASKFYLYNNNFFDLNVCLVFVLCILGTSDSSFIILSGDVDKSLLFIFSFFAILQSRLNQIKWKVLNKFSKRQLNTLFQNWNFYHLGTSFMFHLKNINISKIQYRKRYFLKSKCT